MHVVIDLAVVQGLRDAAVSCRCIVCVRSLVHQHVCARLLPLHGDNIMCAFISVRVAKPVFLGSAFLCLFFGAGKGVFVHAIG